MKKDHTEIAVIIDRSGSMRGMEPQVIKGFNTFLWQQVCAEGTMNMSVVLFDDLVQVLHSSCPGNVVPAMDEATYFVRGSTALFDAVGRTVSELAARIAGMDESARPEHVIVATTTDGYENVSREWTAEMLRELLDEKRAEGWEFIYTSCDENDWQPQALGFKPKDISFYSKEDEDGGFSSYIDMSTRTLGYRGEKK